MSLNTFVSIGNQSMVSELVDMQSIHILAKNLTTALVPQVKTDTIPSWNYVLFEYWQNNGCPNVLHLPMMGGGPLLIITIMSAYLLLVTRFLPRFMSKRSAYELRTPMLVYNTLMVVFNAYFFFKIISHSDYGRIFLNFEFPSNYDNSPREQAIIHTTYLYFLTKFVDLLDTVFFVLRKRDRQVTTLHLYHHTSVPIFAWLTMKLMPTVPAFQLFGILNGLVHTIMYSYYALSALGPSIQPYLWWKRYITQIQIIQFIILIGYSILLGKFQTGFPVPLFWACFVQCPIFFFMFTNFYIQSYRKTKARKSL